MNKNKTIGELLEEARINSGEPKLAGHDIMGLERFECCRGNHAQTGSDLI